MADDSLFQINLVTPERILLTGMASEVILRTGEGDVTFLAGHTPLVGTVQPGVVRVVRPEADEVRVALTRAREICGLMGDAAPLFPVLHGLAKFWTLRGDHAQAHELMGACEKIAAETAVPHFVVESGHSLEAQRADGGVLVFHIRRKAA